MPAALPEAVAPTPAWALLAYLVAGVCFILALRGLSSPESSRAGNRFGMTGMGIAVATTLVVSEFANIERYLALGAEGNIRVANCTTPAQYFHLLRRQARHEEVRPLVIMTPKALLRLPAATSRLDELATGRFAAVIDDADAATRRDHVTRLILCSGKVYYDLMASDLRAQRPHVAVGRVELLYPFPAPELHELIGRYPNLTDVIWTQEEPRNMGARKFFLPKLRDQVLPAGVTPHEVSRPERSSPAEGYPAAHREEQSRIVREAYG
jgi:2-oxoglutarate dehydrogenase E1 component